MEIARICITGQSCVSGERCTEKDMYGIHEACHGEQHSLFFGAGVQETPRLLSASLVSASDSVLWSILNGISSMIHFVEGKCRIRL